MRLLTKVRFTRLLGLLWLGALGLSMLLSAWNTYERTLSVSEYPAGCDAFGYLAMSKEVRRAVANVEMPQFHLESPQSRSLINFLRSRNVPVSDWGEMVAPLASRYFPKADRIGIQYPPGTALALALFPEKRSIHGLNQSVLLSLVSLGVLALVLQALDRRGSPPDSSP